MSVEQQLQQIIQAAVTFQASDIYWLPTTSAYQVLAQTAGKLETIMTLELAAAQQLINHIKYRSNMAISDHRRPQLGAMPYELAAQMLNLRISAVGDFLGRESLVVRVLYEAAGVNLQYLVPKQRHQLTGLLQRSGLILFAGPMGSGKTTTMYDLVRELRGQRVIMTIEDPVEIYEPKFLQLQVNAAAQMSYAELLKVGLRHHPDVFIVGEIRDAETAQIAIQAALSGHLVLSTIHARGVHGILPRLAQLGLAPATVKQALAGVSYQRLVPVTDGTQATLFDIVSTPHELPVQTARLMTAKWGQIIDEQYANGRLSTTVATRLKEA